MRFLLAALPTAVSVAHALPALLELARRGDGDPARAANAGDGGMSRGLGTLQRKIMGVLQPSADNPRPSICLRDLVEQYNVPRAKYEAIRRALAGLEKRDLITRCVIWELACGVRKYALPAISHELDDWLVNWLDEREAKRCGNSRAQPLSPDPTVADEAAPTLKAAPS